MEDPTPIEKIDLVLSIFKPSAFKREYGETKLLIRQQVHTEIEERLLEEILFKLEKDGYLRSETGGHVMREEKTYNADPKIYKLTFEGELFQIKGGYTQELKDINASNRVERIRILILTYGTAAAGAYGVFEILKWLFHHENWKIFF